MRALIAGVRRHARTAATVISLSIIVALALPWYMRSQASGKEGSSPKGPLNELSLYQLTSTWTTDDDRSMQLVSLHGRPQVIALMFTTCTGTCPITVKELQVFAASLPASIGERAGFVLITIDPDDSTEVLRKYRQTMKLDRRFTLLRGEPGSVRELAAIMGFNYEKEGDQYAHTNMVTVLDREGVVIHQQRGAGGNTAELLAVLRRALS
jgi:protein SCO1/2